MNSRLIKNIKHSCEYNAGGIAALYLLDIRDFISYMFRDDKLFTQCFAEKIKAAAEYVQLDTVDESSFKETQENGIYKQQLTTYVRSIEAEKLSALLQAASNRYLVTFRTFQGRAFSFGSDGGAALSFGQQTGQVGETSGYPVTLFKNSIYPLFEVAVDEINKSPRWILEQGSWNADGIWTSNGIWKTI